MISTRAGAVATVLVVSLASCDGGPRRARSAEPAFGPPVPSAPTTAHAAMAPPVSVAPPATVPPPPPPPPPPKVPPGLGPGAKGPEVRALEQRLADLRYDPGRVDGVFDGTTGHAVMAFQKVQGLARTSRATPDVLAAVARAGPVAPLVPGGGANRVEIDLKRQVLFLWRGGALVRILPVSTGSGRRYCVEGECAVAVTPGGSFRVGTKIRGLRVSRLGQLYNPLYFNGGIAIHGSPSVPGRPASHGCVRIPMSASAWFFDSVPAGTPVYVFGGPRAPVPFNEPAPSQPTQAPPPPPPTNPPPTTTTNVPTPGPVP